MNYLLIAILLVIVLILGVLTSILYKLTKKSAAVESKSLEDMAAIMREEHEEKERIKREKELMDYANERIKNVPPRPPMSSHDQSDRLVNINRKHSDLVPFNISELDKRILEEFYKK